MSCDDCYTAREAAKLWGLSTQTVSAALVRGVIQGRKSAGTWLVSHSTMVYHYGPPPNNRVGLDGPSPQLARD